MTPPLKNIVLMATGGTIAGMGEAGKALGYTPGTTSVQSLMETVPGLKAMARLRCQQFLNINSDDMTGTHWLHLAQAIDTLAADAEVDGFVITHGTDTLEETAYFLNLTLKTGKPVVITGSMRPASALSPDGPMNLYQATALAASDAARGQGVLVVFGDYIYGAREVQKQSTFRTTAFGQGDFGALGYLHDGQPHFHQKSTRAHTLATPFTLGESTVLPRVGIATFHVDADPQVLAFMVDHYDGLIIAGAGNGEFSQAWASILEATDKPLVLTSRIGSGTVTSPHSLLPHAITGDNLPPQKARILLMLALTITQDPQVIRGYFERY